jgi:hypothetical protein
MAAYNRDAAGNYADSFYDMPCDDGFIAMSTGICNVEQEFKKRMKGEKRDDWEAKFFWDFVDPKTGTMHDEAACFENKASRANRVLFCPWKGMNDCAHFVSKCLQDGGLRKSIYSPRVPDLEKNLRQLTITKTFGDRIDLERARRIVNTKILKKGDVVVYYKSKGSNGGHSAFYVPDGKITCHTRCRLEEDFNILPGWCYRFIHFSHDDPMPQPQLKQKLAGWWETIYNSKKYYYYYQSNGKVAYTYTKPKNKNQSISAPSQRGYWFGKNSREHLVIWSETGTVERFTFIASDRQKGDYNDRKNVLTAEKL